MGAHFEALDEGVLLVPLDPRYTQVGFNLISVQVCNVSHALYHMPGYWSKTQKSQIVVPRAGNKLKMLLYVQFMADGP